MRCVTNNTASGKDYPALVVPILTPEQTNWVAIGAPTSADKVARVLLPESAEPEKKQLGSPDDGIGQIIYLPPRTENCESLMYLVCEGFCDALSVCAYPDITSSFDSLRVIYNTYRGSYPNGLMF